ncbi:DUF2949 domain-containing protein [Pseudanabaena sp. FACHB-2040]|uniref:DUF2949 domain-containing protein n=1 Tax=Pseudanabaena sp. FACHB-2040 TaxID=2692859 RepID=UPI0016853B96|nr:DUF2949 domain-containing protein [Pseudanabaena sp. FACHB-2040]MBD2258333.1 DUF2949 domain-containing protein [Pseudanabaena sp. FACHB-2040]
MTPSKQTRLIEFLRDTLAVPADALALGLRRAEQAPNLLPMILWQYGFVDLEQLNQIFDWMEQV